MKIFFTYFYTLCLSLWTGGLFIFTFIVTPVIFRSYPRDMAGDIVGRLFPSYFLFCLIITILSLLAFSMSSYDVSDFGYKLSLVLVSIAIVSSLYVNFRLHPQMQRVKQEVRSFETVSPDDPARKKFRVLHAASAAINLFMFADGAALLILSLGIKKTLRQ